MRVRGIAGGRQGSAIILAAVLAALALAVAPGRAGALPDPVHDALLYCNGSLDGGTSGAATTDREHTVLVGDPPLPANVRQFRTTADGISTRVTEAGPSNAREAVVFIHGNIGSSRDFDALVSSAGRFSRAVAFDMPGLGHADKPWNGAYTTEGAAHFIDAMLMRLGIDRVHFVLHDFGGVWGLQWDIEHPGRVASVVLIDTGVLINFYGTPLELIWHTPILGELEVMATTRQIFDDGIQAQNPRPLPQAFVDRMYDDWDRPGRCAMLHYYRDIANPNALGRTQAAALRQRITPALVIWGKQDPYLPSSLAAEQKQAFPTADIHVLDKSGHWPFMDYPQTVHDLVIPFLRRLVGIPGTDVRLPAHAPRFRIHHGRLRAGRRTPFALWIRVDGRATAHAVTARLYHGRKLVGETRTLRALGAGWRRLTLRLREQLPAGRYVLRVAARGLPQQLFTITIRR